MDTYPAAPAAPFPASPDERTLSRAPARARPGRAGLTREAGLWIGVAALAIAPRALNLGHAPLTDAEAGLALQTAAFLRGESVSFLNPLFGALQAALFAIFGPSDAAARAIAAAAGAALCLLPAAMRRELGPARALFFGALLAISPTLWFVSRQALGGGLAWALAAAAWWSWHSGKGGLAWTPAGGARAGGVDAGAPALVVAAALAAGRDLRSCRPRAGELAAAGLAFLAGSTAFGWRLDGVADAFNGYAEWARLLLQPGPLSPLRGLTGALVLEPVIWLAALAGLAGLVYARLAGRGIRRPGDGAAVWLAWIGAGLALFLATGSRQVDGLAPVVFGAASLAAAAGAILIRTTASRGNWSAMATVAGIALIMLVYAFLGFLQYAGQGLLLWLLTGAIAAAMVAGVAVVGTLTYGLSAAWSGVCAALGACLLAYTLAAGIQLTYTRPDNPAEPYVVAPASADIRQLAAAVEQLAARAYGDAGSLPLRIAGDAPASLRWALRGQRQLTSTGAPGASGATLLPAGVEPEGAFIGRPFTVSSSAPLAAARCDLAGEQVNCQGLAQWLAFRALGAETPSLWVLWLSPDLARRASGQP